MKGLSDTDDSDWMDHEIGLDDGFDDLSTDADGSPTTEGQPSLARRLRRGANIVALGEWQGIVFGWRDRATILGKVTAYVLAALAATSLGLEAAGFHPEPLWEVETAARQAIISGIDGVAAVAHYGLNHEWVVLLTALLALALYRW